MRPWQIGWLQSASLVETSEASATWTSTRSL